MKTFSYLTALFLGFTLLLSGIPTHAVTETTLGGDMTAEINPENPGPNTETAVSIQSTSLDLQNATITWSVNGRVIKQGIGETGFSFTTGPTGRKTTVFVSATGQNGELIEKNLVFVPQNVTLLWEADSSVPQLYPGKALPARGGTVRIVALPDFVTETGRAIPPNELFYAWNQLETGLLNQNNASGRGIQTFSAKSGLMRSVKVSLTVSDANKTTIVQKLLEIPVVEPFISLYEEHPLTGKQPRALKETFSLPKEEVTLRAEPFFFSFPLTNVIPSWTVGNTGAPADTENPWLLTLRRAPNARGTAPLRIVANHPDFRLQSSSQTLTVEF